MSAFQESVKPNWLKYMLWILTIISFKCWIVLSNRKCIPDFYYYLSAIENVPQIAQMSALPQTEVHSFTPHWAISPGWISSKGEGLFVFGRLAIDWLWCWCAAIGKRFCISSISYWWLYIDRIHHWRTSQSPEVTYKIIYGWTYHPSETLQWKPTFRIVSEEFSEITESNQG